MPPLLRLMPPSGLLTGWPVVVQFLNHETVGLSDTLATALDASMPAVLYPIPPISERIHPSHLEALALAGRLAADTALMLTSGGDSRITCDPATGRNRYGTRTTPCPDELFFASTTANNVTLSSFQVADRALDQLLTSGLSNRLQIEQWFDEIRARISSHLGAAGSATILAASGTDAELIALSLVAGLTHRPVTNILVAPDETGSGVPMAAAGRHFLRCTALGAIVEAGSAINADLVASTEVRSIAIRADDGSPREPQAIDRDVAIAVAQELRRGRDVLLHLLDTSKTGLAGVSRSVARQLAACAPSRVRVVVDACQLRCPFEKIRQDLNDGFMVIATGSKFAGGPPFSGALLLSQSLAEEIARDGTLAPGLCEYSARLDWPTKLRARFNASLSTEANIGLGLRWVAALDLMDRVSRISAPLRASMIARFASAVAARTSNLRFIACPAYIGHNAHAASSIIPLTVLDRAGQPASFDEAQRIHAGLRAVGDAPICHVGQAVRLGSRTVLRLAMSANDLAVIAERHSTQTLDEAFRPLEADLDAVLAKWALLAHKAGPRQTA